MYFTWFLWILSCEILTPMFENSTLFPSQPTFIICLLFVCFYRCEVVSSCDLQSSKYWWGCRSCSVNVCINLLWWFEWEKSPQSWAFGLLGLSWWHCLEAFRWYGIVEGRMSLGVGFETKASWCFVFSQLPAPWSHNSACCCSHTDLLQTLNFWNYKPK